MILFILFYLAVAIAAGLLIALGFFFYLKNRSLSASQDQSYIGDRQNLRPLFAPSEADLLAFEREREKVRLEFAEEEKHRAAKQEFVDKMKGVNTLFTDWAATPDSRRLGELLAAAASTENAEFYSEISTNVIQIWHDKKIAGLTAADLAGLLDSHLRLLPQQEIVSGALFWLKQEIAALRYEENNF